MPFDGAQAPKRREILAVAGRTLRRIPRPAAIDLRRLGEPGDLHHVEQRYHARSNSLAWHIVCADGTRYLIVETRAGRPVADECWVWNPRLHNRGG